MTKYATQRQYQPYIDAIMDDLGLTGKVDIEWRFRPYNSMDGDAVLYGDKNSYYKPNGIVRVDHRLSHVDILITILHELKHISQDFQGYYEPTIQTYIAIDGTVQFKHIALWHGQEYESFNHASADFHPEHKKYWNSPWEVEAREYEKEINRLFPNGELRIKKLIGVADGVKFYKIAS